MKTCWLEISSYQGYSIGAEHTYGVVKLRDENGKTIGEEQVRRPITQAEADKMNANSPAAVHWPSKAGDMAHGFYSEQEVIVAAVSLFDELGWNDGETKMVVGSYTVAEPHRVLVGPEPMKSKTNEFADRAKACQDADDEDGYFAVCDEHDEWCGKRFSK